MTSQQINTIAKPLITEKELSERLRDLSCPILVVRRGNEFRLSANDTYELAPDEEIVAQVPALPIENLGDAGFKSTYGVRYAYYAGAMANGIASVEMVIALGKAGFMGSYGSAGITGSRLEAAIKGVQGSLPEGPYAFNLLNSPNEPALERKAVELYLQHGVRVIEAAAYLDMTAPLIHYRAAGLSQLPDGGIQIANRVIAKVSRREVAEKFMQPAPEKLLTALVSDGRISHQQAELARLVPVADDVTVEADSAGHTDNRPLVCLLPGMQALRDELQSKHRFTTPVRIGAAGGISTPSAALGAFMMGAAYIVTGSVNQACVESGASEHTRKLLARADMADITMAPSADMFEMGVKVQVLKLGTFYPMRAQKLYDLYSRYDSIEQIPADEREKLESKILQRPIEAVWQDTVKFFSERDPSQVERAVKNPRYKMALIFRWYLGLSSRWSISGEKGREMDYQVWCGPAMGSFNMWSKGTYLEEPQNRHVVDVARQLLTGAAYQYRLEALRMTGVGLPQSQIQYVPSGPIGEL